MAHTIYGVPQTINTANYVYFQAMKGLLAMDEHTQGDSEQSQQGSSINGGGGVGNAKGKGKEVDLVAVVTGELTCLPSIRTLQSQHGVATLLSLGSSL